VQSHEQTEDEEDRLRSGLDTKGEDDHHVVSLSLNLRTSGAPALC
jgi:hypothetical protein